MLIDRNQTLHQSEAALPSILEQDHSSRGAQDHSSRASLMFKSCVLLLAAVASCRVVNVNPTDTGSTSTAVGGFKLGPALAPIPPGDDAGLGSNLGAAGDSSDSDDSGDSGSAGASGSSGDATDSVPSESGSSLVPCGSVLTGVVRDFKGANEPGGHPDFEAFGGADPSLGIVLPELGKDRKPVYSAEGPFIDQSENGDAANGQQTTDKAHFDQWYRTVPGVNLAFTVYISSETRADLRTFETDAFFPLDGAGWGNTPGFDHNYSFTTEIHTRFTYRTGQLFAFTGDDDLWVFINHQLVIDLGGLHSATSKSLQLDTQREQLGLEVGRVYDLDLFHAERHSVASDFHMDTNIEFVDCGIIVPD